jgi:hypothetical protein
MKNKKNKSPVFIGLLFLALITAASVSTAKSNKQIVLIPQPKSNETTPQLISALQKWDKGQFKIAQECKEMAIDYNPTLNKMKANEFYKLSYFVLINNDDLYSLIVKTFRYCGGAYPSIDENAIVFNKKNGSRIDPIDLYNITQKNKHGYTLKPAIQSLTRSALLRELDKDSIENRCKAVINQDEFDYLEPNTVGLGKKGLHIMYSGPHVVQACYKTIILPYQQVSRFLNLAKAKKLNWKTF